MTTQTFVDEATLNELVNQRKNLLDQAPEIEKALKAQLISEQQKKDYLDSIARIEQILRVYRPAALSPAAQRRG